jgi:hypothetical protein
MNTIIGAGLAGLIAASAWPRAQIVEASAEPRAMHKALLRFRGESVSALTGIPFRRVQVRKSIWFNNAHRPANIRLANLYTRKILGAPYGDRSIWNLDAVDRFIGPETLYEQLIEMHAPRIFWSTPFDFEGYVERREKSEYVVSTAPMPVTLRSLGLAQHADLAFTRAPITVARFRVPKADLFQTVYFPTEQHSVYRASITKDLLIVEHAGDAERGDWFEQVLMAFGLDQAEFIDTGSQSYGKILPLPEAARKQLLFQLTQERGIFSLGRFATWRNILLDDVVQDITRIKALSAAGAAAYDLRLSAR